MSWFSRSFSTREEERDLGEEDEEKEPDDPLNFSAIASATGATVKEDLSNLTKTFSRQLWGVASFLAPPPPEKSAAAEEGCVGGGLRGDSVDVQGNDGEVRSFNDTVENESENERIFGKENLGHTEFHFFEVGEGTSGGILLPEESDPRGTAASPKAGGENVNRGSDRPMLTGLRSDFAELRGTMATGFSRLSSVIRVVAGDDDRELDEEHLSAISAHNSSHPLPSPGGGDQYVNSPRRGLDTFLKPILGNMLMSDGSSIESSTKGDGFSEEDEAAEKHMDARKSRGEGESTSKELESLPLAIASSIDGISKFASSLLQIVRDEDDEGKEDELEDQYRAVGLTEGVVTFARNIASHAETWLDFPLTEDDADDDFELTDAQQEHLHALEVVAPDLEALKIELCPKYMTEKRFWKIYFVLMHSRLSSNEALMLSTGQVVRARESMLQELQKRQPQTDELDSSQEGLMKNRFESDAVEAHQQDQKQSEEVFGSDLLAQSTSPVANVDRSVFSSLEDEREEKKVGEPDHKTSGSRGETEPVEPTSVPGKGRFFMPNLEDETEVDEWLDEEPLTKQQEVGIGHSHLDMSNMDDEDVSFSDLEEDESPDKAAHTDETITSSSPKSSGSAAPGSVPTMSFVASDSPPTQGDGTPRKSSEFNDWLTVDQDDVGSAGSSSP